MSRVRPQKVVEKTEPAGLKNRRSNDVVTLNNIASPNVVRANYDMFMGQLLESIPPVMSTRFYDMYCDAWEYVEGSKKYDNLTHEEKQQKTLSGFQQLLGLVPKWEDERIIEETEFVTSSLPWLREALRQMLIARVSILMSVRSDKRTNGNFEFAMPDDERIVHTFFIRAARKIRGKAYLYNHDVDEVEREENALIAEDIIKSSLETSIPSLVPLKEVVQTHLINHADDESEPPIQDEEEEESLEEEQEFEYELEEEEEESSSSSESFENHNQEDNEMEVNLQGEALPTEEEESDEPEKEKPVLKLDPEDAPADRSVAQETILQGDTPKTVKLKVKASQLNELIDDLKRQRKRIHPRQKEHAAALDEEIEFREAQLDRTKSRLKKIK